MNAPMKPYVHIIDDFFVYLPHIRAEIARFSTADTINPRDGKLYSNITVPAESSRLLPFVGNKLAKIMHSQVQITLMLSRLSLAGGYVPYEAHSDAFMGAYYTAVIYLNDMKDCQGGTAFLRHKATGAEVWNAKTPPTIAKQLDADVSNSSAWDTTFLAPMRPGRAVIYPGELIHRSEPLGGFGTTEEDGRRVLVVLFNQVATP